jgi:hypothetical protein
MEEQSTARYRRLSIDSAATLQNKTSRFLRKQDCVCNAPHEIPVSFNKTLAPIDNTPKQTSRRSRFNAGPDKTVKLKHVRAADGPLRTPLHFGDGWKSQDSYEVEKVLASRLERGVTQYKVKWSGISKAGCTWEPEKHIRGTNALSMLKDFKDALAQQAKVNFPFFDLLVC